MTCKYCGQEHVAIVNEDGTGMCNKCFSIAGTCYLCEQGTQCDFETNPINLPKQEQKTIRQGNMVMQTVVKNEARIKACCLPCICFNKENQICNKEYGTCCNYKELLSVCPSNS